MAHDCQLPERLLKLQQRFTQLTGASENEPAAKQRSRSPPGRKVHFDQQANKDRKGAMSSVEFDLDTTATEENMSSPSSPSKGTSEVRARKKTTAGQFPAPRPQRNLEVVGVVLVALSWLLVIATFPLSLTTCVRIVAEYERLVIFRLGRLVGQRGPGMIFTLPCIEDCIKVDMRTVSFEVPPQEIITKDSVTVSVDAVVYYRTSNAVVSVVNVENAEYSTRLLAQTTLRNILGTRSLSGILSEREAIAAQMQTILDEATLVWGIKVERVEVKDVRIPVSLQRSLAAEAEATREARAKVIMADGERRASKALRAASDELAQSDVAVQLRYLQVLTGVSSETNSTVIFPVPVDFMRKVSLALDKYVEGETSADRQTSEQATDARL